MHNLVHIRWTRTFWRTFSHAFAIGLIRFQCTYVRTWVEFVCLEFFQFSSHAIQSRIKRKANALLTSSGEICKRADVEFLFFYNNYLIRLQHIFIKSFMQVFRCVDTGNDYAVFNKMWGSVDDILHDIFLIALSRNVESFHRYTTVHHLFALVGPHPEFKVEIGGSAGALIPLSGVRICNGSKPSVWQITNRAFAFLRSGTRYRFTTVDLPKVGASTHRFHLTRGTKSDWTLHYCRKIFDDCKSIVCIRKATIILDGFLYLRGTVLTMPIVHGNSLSCMSTPGKATSLIWWIYSLEAHFVICVPLEPTAAQIMSIFGKCVRSVESDGAGITQQTISKHGLCSPVWYSDQAKLIIHPRRLNVSSAECSLSALPPVFMSPPT